jgi:hypothetical protein
VDSGSVRHASRWHSRRYASEGRAVLFSSHVLADAPVSELTTADARVRGAGSRPTRWPCSFAIAAPAWTP